MAAIRNGLKNFRTESKSNVFKSYTSVYKDETSQPNNGKKILCDGHKTRHSWSSTFNENVKSKELYSKNEYNLYLKQSPKDSIKDIPLTAKSSISNMKLESFINLSQKIDRAKKIAAKHLIDDLKNVHTFIPKRANSFMMLKRQCTEKISCTDRAALKPIRCDVRKLNGYVVVKKRSLNRNAQLTHRIDTRDIKVIIDSADTLQHQNKFDSNLIHVSKIKSVESFQFLNGSELLVGEITRKSGNSSKFCQVKRHNNGKTHKKWLCSSDLYARDSIETKKCVQSTGRQTKKCFGLSSPLTSIIHGIYWPRRYNSVVELGKSACTGLKIGKPINLAVLNGRKHYSSSSYVSDFDETKTCTPPKELRKRSATAVDNLKEHIVYNLKNIPKKECNIILDDCKLRNSLYMNYKKTAEKVRMENQNCLNNLQPFIKSGPPRTKDDDQALTQKDKMQNENKLSEKQTKNDGYVCWCDHILNNTCQMLTGCGTVETKYLNKENNLEQNEVDTDVFLKLKSLNNLFSPDTRENIPNSELNWIAIENEDTTTVELFSAVVDPINSLCKIASMRNLFTPVLEKNMRSIYNNTSTKPVKKIRVLKKTVSKGRKTALDKNVASRSNGDNANKQKDVWLQNFKPNEQGRHNALQKYHDLHKQREALLRRFKLKNPTKRISSLFNWKGKHNELNCTDQILSKYYVSNEVKEKCERDIILNNSKYNISKNHVDQKEGQSNISSGTELKNVNGEILGKDVAQNHDITDDILYRISENDADVMKGQTNESSTGELKSIADGKYGKDMTQERGGMATSDIAKYTVSENNANSTEGQTEASELKKTCSDNAFQKNSCANDFSKKLPVERISEKLNSLRNQKKMLTCLKTQPRSKINIVMKNKTVEWCVESQRERDLFFKKICSAHFNHQSASKKNDYQQTMIKEINSKGNYCSKVYLERYTNALHNYANALKRDVSDTLYGKRHIETKDFEKPKGTNLTDAIINNTEVTKDAKRNELDTQEFLKGNDVPNQLVSDNSKSIKEIKPEQEMPNSNLLESNESVSRETSKIFLRLGVLLEDCVLPVVTDHDKTLESKSEACKKLDFDKRHSESNLPKVFTQIPEEGKVIRSGSVESDSATEECKTVVAKKNEQITPETIVENDSKDIEKGIDPDCLISTQQFNGRQENVKTPVKCVDAPFKKVKTEFSNLSSVYGKKLFYGNYHDNRCVGADDKYHVNEMSIYSVKYTVDKIRAQLQVSTTEFDKRQQTPVIEVSSQDTNGWNNGSHFNTRKIHFSNYYKKKGNRKVYEYNVSGVLLLQSADLNLKEKRSLDDQNDDSHAIVCNKIKYVNKLPLTIFKKKSISHNIGANNLKNGIQSQTLEDQVESDGVKASVEKPMNLYKLEQKKIPFKDKDQGVFTKEEIKQVKKADSKISKMSSPSRFEEKRNILHTPSTNRFRRPSIWSQNEVKTIYSKSAFAEHGGNTVSKKTSIKDVLNSGSSRNLNALNNNLCLFPLKTVVTDGSSMKINSLLKNESNIKQLNKSTNKNSGLIEMLQKELAPSFNSARKSNRICKLSMEHIGNVMTHKQPHVKTARKKICPLENKHRPETKRMVQAKNVRKYSNNNGERNLSLIQRKQKKFYYNNILRTKCNLTSCDFYCSVNLQPESKLFRAKDLFRDKSRTVYDSFGHAEFREMLSDKISKSYYEYKKKNRKISNVLLNNEIEQPKNLFDMGSKINIRIDPMFKSVHSNRKQKARLLKYIVKDRGISWNV